MESDDARFLGGVEMAGDCVSDHCLEFIERVRFGEDGKTERPGVVAAFRGFLDGKDDFTWSHVFGPFFIIRCEQTKTERFANPPEGKTQT
jgi:hypothetical protein